MIPIQAGKKTKHNTSLSLPLTKVAFGKQQQAFACLFPLVGEDSFNYVAMQGNIVQSLALLMYSGSK